MSGRPSPASEAWLRRYARQVVLPEIGEAGQRRIGEATVRLAGRGDALLACAVCLSAAGIGALELADATLLSALEAGRFPFAPGFAGRRRDEALAAALVGRGSVARVADVEAPQEGVLVATCAAPARWVASFRAAGTGPVGKAEGALAADAILRRIAGAPIPEGGVVVAEDGTVRRGPTTGVAT